MPWLDTHCHWDAAEFDPDREALRAQARSAGVSHCVIPAVERANWDRVRALAHGAPSACADAYALGIHPLYTPGADEADLPALRQALCEQVDDPRLVALGEIGLDGFVPGLDWERQTWFYREQLRLAREFDLPVILHVRRSADALLAGLRAVGGRTGWRGIAHAFNGSGQQAKQFIDLGFKLGFGGSLTYERASQIRRLATELPLNALVLETDAPDIPPHWLYRSAEERAAGIPQGRNSPAELPRIAACLAQLRGLSLAELAQATSDNAVSALPKLSALIGVTP
jgi:TatD DNase family protein